MGVLAGTHWGDDSSRVMSHQSANPLWLCRVGGHGRDRGRELSCGLVMWTSFIHALFKHISEIQIFVSEVHILVEQPSRHSARGRHANLSFQTKFAPFQDLDLFSLLNTFLQHE